MVRHGSRGPAVLDWQRFLISNGAAIAADGIFGRATEAATRAYQRAAGLPETGTVDAATLARSASRGTAPSAASEQEVRRGHVERALAVVGLGARDPGPYLDLVATNPADRADAETCRALLAMSGCALVVRGLWSRAGVRPRAIVDRYRIGRAVSDVVETATAAGAYRPPTEPPSLGSVVLVGSPEHVLTVVGVKGGELEVVEGGQRDGSGKQTIALHRKTYNGKQIGGRPILCVVDPVALSLAWKGSANV